VGRSKDLYELLGLPREAPQEDIRKAHRSLVREYHPDANPGDDSAEERFKEVQHAYEVLSDPRKRREYDEALLRASSRGGGDSARARARAQATRTRARRGAGTSGGGGRSASSGEDLSDLLRRLKSAFSDAWSGEPASNQHVSGGKTSGVSSGPREKKVKGPSTRRKGKRVKGPKARREND
jgi:curved DNA-binding protein CbpA